MFNRYAKLKPAQVKSLPNLNNIYCKALYCEPVKAIQTIRRALTDIASTSNIADRKLKEKIAGLLMVKAEMAEENRLYLDALLANCDALLLLKPNSQTSSDCGWKISFLAKMLKDDSVRMNQQNLPDTAQINEHVKLTLHAMGDLYENKEVSFARIIRKNPTQKLETGKINARNKPARTNNPIKTLFRKITGKQHNNQPR